MIRDSINYKSDKYWAISFIVFIHRKPRQINRENITSNAAVQDILGEGRFGLCYKKLYRGHKVAVKYYKKSTIKEVYDEAAHISDCDHPGRLS